jgi:MFS family permease
MNKTTTKSKKKIIDNSLQIRKKINNGIPANVLVPAPPRRRFNWAQTFTALKYPNYQLWFYGQMASLMGTWMQTTAQGFLIYELTKSPVYLGLVGFAAGAPFWLFNFIGGVITDRMPRRNILLVTQTVMMLLAFILGFLCFAGVVKPWHIVMLAFGTGIANAFDAPARMAFVPELVEREDLTNAMALNSTFVNLAVVVGPAAAGLVYAWAGPGWCFTINGFSFIAVIAALFFMRLKPFFVHPHEGSVLVQLREGISYTIHHPMIRALMILVVIASIFGNGFMTLLPAWAINILNGDATTNGLLQSARGAGALMAALMIASLGRIKFKGKLLTIGSFVFPLMIIAWAFITSLPLSLLVLAVIGWGSMLMFNMAITLIQLHVPDGLRGRVMGIYAFAFFGMTPVGAILAGVMAEWTTEPITVIIDGLITLVIAFIILFGIPKLRAME